MIPGVDGKKPDWTPAADRPRAHRRAAARARPLARADPARPGKEGRLAYGFIEDLFPDSRETRTLDEVAEETGLEPALIERIWTSVGFSAQALDSLTPRTCRRSATSRPCSTPASRSSRSSSSRASTGRRCRRSPTPRRACSTSTCTSRSCATACPASRWPRRWSTSRATCCRSRRRSWTTSTSATSSTSSSRTWSATWRWTSRTTRSSGASRSRSRSPTSPGYTRFTEEEGEEEALSYVERFIEAVQDTLPEDARVVKTIGDEVMVVGHDVAGARRLGGRLPDAVTDRPTPRIGIHDGSTLYRDGDYFGRDVNLASRVVARAARRRGARHRRGDGRDRRPATTSSSRTSAR